MTNDMLTAMILNETNRELELAVVNLNSSFPLASVRSKGGDYTMRLGMNWAFREFLLTCKSGGEKLSVNSDDFCDYKLITVQEIEGKLILKKVLRKNESSDCNSTVDSKMGKKFGKRIVWS
uniref:DUF7748 domain-containing protein n=1 Tax=Physcomitrium patens TaxID=3218 RepID=A0A2K1JTZ6_PHYPA|nr:hypothetical protein PHYPA_014746 [Physcomitrium patens]